MTTITTPTFLIVWLSVSIIFYSVAKIVEIVLDMRLRELKRKEEKKTETWFIDCDDMRGEE